MPPPPGTAASGGEPRMIRSARSSVVAEWVPPLKAPHAPSTLPHRPRGWGSDTSDIAISREMKSVWTSMRVGASPSPPSTMSCESMSFPSSNGGAKRARRSRPSVLPARSSAYPNLLITNGSGRSSQKVGRRGVPSGWMSSQLKRS
eukprot:scaffold174351_cov29-Tisochrysis_lutea.AAC.1